MLHLYDNILIPIESALDRMTSSHGSSIELPQLLKLGVYQQTSESLGFVPTEIRDSIRRFQVEHPDPLSTAFIMMRFGNSRVHNEITAAIRSTLSPYGIEGLRADDKQYHDDLFSNVLTYMHGCGFGIAVFERIETDEFNPNVSLEVGYMLALRKSVCLLKDKTLRGLQVDLVGKLYSVFDTYDIMNTTSSELSKWLVSKGFAS